MSESVGEYTSLTQIRSSLQEGHTTSEAATTAMLQRISAVDPAIKSYVTVAAEQAIEIAQTVTTEIAGMASRTARNVEDILFHSDSVIDAMEKTTKAIWNEVNEVAEALKETAEKVMNAAKVVAEEAFNEVKEVFSSC